MSDSIHVHKLDGCRPTPLAHYLKALGIFRLIAEQADPVIRGWWKDDTFRIATKLDREALEQFFLNDYAPTPIFAPWNGGSGFYPKDNKSGIDPLIASTAARFESYRDGIQQTQAIVGEADAKPDKGEPKNGMLADCRSTWRGGSRHWIDAAMTMDSTGDASFPAILGTGGNDGRLDFTNNFMQGIVSLFDPTDADGAPNADSALQLVIAFWSGSAPKLRKSSAGQFLPSSADGTKVNPWDFVLMIEGAVVFQAGISRRCNSIGFPQASAPFAVRSCGVGYGSSDAADENARGEQWMPLWSHPSSFKEVNCLFNEGRSSIKRQAAMRGTEMARAVARVGVVRGVDQFQRYAYIERNGLANLAVPIGRFSVRAQSNQELLDEVAPWVDHVRRLANAKNAPATFGRVHQACAEALLTCVQAPIAESFLSLLVAMGQAEDQMLMSRKYSKENYAKPIPKLSSKWADLIWRDCRSAELNLAIALAAQRGKLTAKELHLSVRNHWLPLDGSWFATGKCGLQVSPDQSAVGLDLERALIAMLHRRTLAMSRGATSGFLPLHVNWKFGASTDDIEKFLNFQVDDARLLSIARGLMAVDLFERDVANPSLTEESAKIEHGPLGGLAAYGLLRLATPTGEDGVSLSRERKIPIRCNPTVLRRLQAGDLGKAIELAARQMSNAGLRPRFTIGTGSAAAARRLAASLAFGVHPKTLTRLAYGLTDPQLDDQTRQKLEADTANP